MSQNSSLPGYHLYFPVVYALKVTGDKQSCVVERLGEGVRHEASLSHSVRVQSCHVRSLTLAMVREFTPQELANATGQVLVSAVSPLPRNWLLNVYQHTPGQRGLRENIPSGVSWTSALKSPIIYLPIYLSIYLYLYTHTHTYQLQ